MNNKLGLVFPTIESRDHWMVKRMFKRAGVDLPSYETFVVGPTILQDLNASSVSTILLFGNITLQHILGRKDILRWFNRVVDLKLQRGTILCVPCIEPKRLLNYRGADPYSEEYKLDPPVRSPTRFQGVVAGCLKQAVWVSENGRPIETPANYTLDPTPMAFTTWVNNFFTANVDELSSDIETPYKLEEDDEDELEERERQKSTVILRISFAYLKDGVYHAVSIPWLPEYFSDVQRLYTFNQQHVMWNGVQFDSDILEANGVIINGLVVDHMDCYHLLQSDLPKGLEAVSGIATNCQPWKHLNDVDPSLYSAIDSHIALECAQFIKRNLTAIGLWDRALEEMEIIQYLRQAGKRGNLVNEVFRLEYKAELETLLYDAVLKAQGMVAEKFHKRKLYKKLPDGVEMEDWQRIVKVVAATACSKCHKVGGISTKHKCPEGEGWEKVKTTREHEHWFERDPFSHVRTFEEMRTELKKGNGFNPTSANQMREYMRVNKHPLGFNHKTEKETADVKHIKSLLAKYDEKHPIYRHTLNIRLIQKALSTYVNGLAPDERGRFVTTFKNGPSTWRLSSANVNVQNLSKKDGNPYATRARKIVIPDPGYVIIAADSSAIEAVFVGYFMNNPDYIKLARKGVHSYVTCKWLKYPFDDAHIKKVKKDHKDLYNKFKTVNHSINFGASDYQVWKNQPETFKTHKEAKELYKFIFKSLPGLQDWHRQLQMTAKKNGYLDNPWGFRHYFYDVFTYKYDENTTALMLDDEGLPKVKLGKDAKRVIALKPQSSAAFFMRDNIKLIGRSKWRECMPAVAVIHDSYALLIKDDPAVIEEAKQFLIETLTRPIPQLGGLRVGCEVSLHRDNFLDEEIIATVDVE